MTLTKTLLLAVLINLMFLIEIQCAGLPGYQIGAYATSSHKLDAFEKRVAEAEDAGFPGYQIGAYAASNHKLDAFKKRVAEAE